MQGQWGQIQRLRDQVVAISHNDQDIAITDTPETISEKARLGFDTGVKGQGSMSKADVKSSSVSDKPSKPVLPDNKAYMNLYTANQKLNSENQALTTKLKALEKQRESAGGKEKGKAEMEIVRVKDSLNKNEYQLKLNDKEMKAKVDASVDIELPSSPPNDKGTKSNQ